MIGKLQSLNMNFYKVLKDNQYKSGDFKLLPIENDHKYLIMQWRNEQMYHLRQHKKLEKADQDLYFENVVTKLFNQDRPSQILFSFLKGDELVGYGGLVHINWIDKHAEISFLMDTSLENTCFEEFWTTYLKLIEKVAFDDLNFNKIYTYAFDLRPHLYPVLENAGFLLDAQLNEHVIFENRLVDVIIHSKWNKKVFLRTALESDLELTFKWANNSAVRKYSFNKANIDFENHKNWFYSKLSADSCFYYILQYGVLNVGSIRIDFESNNLHKIGWISYLIDPLFHGKGFGTKILGLVESKIFEEIEDLQVTLKGKVMLDNLSSVKIFEKLNYSQDNIQDHVIQYSKIIYK